MINASKYCFCPIQDFLILGVAICGLKYDYVKIRKLKSWVEKMMKLLYP